MISSLLQIADRKGQRAFIVCRAPANSQEKLLNFFSGCLVKQSRSMQKEVEMFPTPEGNIFTVVNPPTDASILLKVFEDQAQGSEFMFERVLLADKDYDSLAVFANQLQMSIKINWRKLLPRRNS